MQKHIIGIGPCIWFSIVWVGASYALDRDQEYAVYQSLRKTSQEEFQVGMRILSAYRGPSTTDKVFEIGIDLLKVMLYNKAYMHIQCALLAPKDQNASTFLDDCTDERLQAFSRVYTRSQTIGLEKGPTARMAEPCFQQARLTQEEEQFPPFDFLAGSHTYLYNVKKLEGCYSDFIR
jgi:hypothetical protein